MPHWRNPAHELEGRAGTQKDLDRQAWAHRDLLKYSRRNVSSGLWDRGALLTAGELLSWNGHEHLDLRGSGLERKTPGSSWTDRLPKQGQQPKEWGRPAPATSGHLLQPGGPRDGGNWSNLDGRRESQGAHDSSLPLLLCHTEKMGPGSSLRWAAEGRDDRHTETGEDPSGNGEIASTARINEPPARATLGDSAVAVLGGF